VIVDDVCTTGASTGKRSKLPAEFGFEVVGGMCLVEREEAKGRPNLEKAAAPRRLSRSSPQAKCAPNTQCKTTTPRLQSSRWPAVCELCGRPAVTNNPRSRCAAHKGSVLGLP